jgi:hypothetical protein
VKRDKALLFQCLVSAVFVALAGLAGLSLFATARLSQQPKVEPLEASRNLAFADHGEWNQFYDAVVGVGRTAEIPQPADAVPENRAPGDAVNGPATTRMSVDQAPSPGIAPAATTASPVVPPSEPAVKTEAPSTQTAARPERPEEKGVNSAAPNEPSRDQKPRATAPSVAATDSAPPAAPVVSTPRTKAAAPPVRNAVRVKQAAPEPEREPERSRPSVPSRARVALPRQRNVPQSDGPQWNGTQWVDPQHFGPPQHQSGALSYAPPEYSAQPPGGPQFGPYFPYGSRPPTAQRARAPQSRSPQPGAVNDDSRQFAPQQPAPRQPAQSFNDPYRWR